MKLGLDGSVVGTFGVGGGFHTTEFDGANIWISSSGDKNLTKLRASDGAPVGSFAAGTFPFFLAFDGANIWVADFMDLTLTKF
jgi:hypothetical protein